jgi:hypothetical protein
VDLGPEGGAEGGEIVAVGPPEAIASCGRSHTGRALAAAFAQTASATPADGTPHSRTWSNAPTQTKARQ